MCFTSGELIVEMLRFDPRGNLREVHTDCSRARLFQFHEDDNTLWCLELETVRGIVRCGLFTACDDDILVRLASKGHDGTHS